MKKIIIILFIIFGFLFPLKTVSMAQSSDRQPFTPGQVSPFDQELQTLDLLWQNVMLRAELNTIKWNELMKKRNDWLAKERGKVNK
jgi:hypothetical protein